MDPEGGAQSVERMRAAGNSDAKMYIVPKAGHHGQSLFLPFLPHRAQVLIQCKIAYSIPR